MCRRQTTKTSQFSKTSLQCFSRKYGTAGKLSLKIQVTKLDFTTGLGVQVELSHPKIRLEMVKPACKILIFFIPEIERKKLIYALKSFMKIVDLLSF